VEIARAVFENNPEAIYQGMVRALKKGDARVFKVLADRAYGKVKEQVEFGLGDDLSAMSNAELNAHIAKLTANLGFHLHDPSDLACLSINRKIKNKICGADDLEGLGSGVTVWRMAHLSAAVVRP
jgi:hypothetical protein